MKEQFEANQISIEEQQGMQSLALFNDRDQYVFFQCPQEKQDWDNGVYVEYGDENHGGYDVVAGIKVSETLLSIQLKSPLLGLPDVDAIEVALNVDRPQLSDLVNKLQAAFEGRLAEIKSTL